MSFVEKSHRCTRADAPGLYVLHLIGERNAGRGILTQGLDHREGALVMLGPTSSSLGEIDMVDEFQGNVSVIF
jgi:hypothetical protein